MRFGFFGDEESDLEGSTGYLEGLSAANRKKIKMYLNVDMVASPNGGYFVQGGEPGWWRRLWPGKGDPETACRAEAESRPPTTFTEARPYGLTMGNVGGGLVSNAVLGESGVLYDIDKLIYLGSPHSHYHWVFMSRREARARPVWKPCARLRALELALNR